MKNTLSRKSVPAAIMSIALWLATSSNAQTVYFDDADRGPADSLQIGALSISGTLPVRTVSGVGLGLDNGISPLGEMDETLHFLPGSMIPDTPIRPADLGLTISLSGPITITAVTIEPHYRVFSSTGTLLPLPNQAWAFSIMDDFHQPLQDIPTYSVYMSSIDQPLTLQPDWPYGMYQFTSVYLGSIGSGDIDGPEGEFIDYRMQHLSEEQTIQVGFSVLSLTYAPIPEPGTIGLFALGLVGTVLLRLRGRQSSRPSD